MERRHGNGGRRSISNSAPHDGLASAGEGTRPEVITNNLKGIAGVYVYAQGIIAAFPKLDMRLVDAWKGLDTFGFIGAVPVVPYELPHRTHAIDRPTDIPIVEAKLS